MATVALGPASVNITGVLAGDRNEFTVLLTRAGVPINLTGQVVTAQARTTAADTLALDAVCTITNAPGGALTVRWPGDAVTTWLSGKPSATGVWDLQLDDGVLDPVTVAAGTFAAGMDVTRP